MIYTITFNPALDYIVRLDHLKTGTINRTTQEYVLGGGKGIKRIYRTQQLGHGYNGTRFHCRIHR